MTFYVSCLLNTLSSCLKKKKQNTGSKSKSKSKSNAHCFLNTYEKYTH